MLDSCDNAGVMHIDIELMEFILKEKIIIEEIKSYFEKKIIFFKEDKIIIRNFMKYQNNHNSPLMKKHIDKLLDVHGIADMHKNGEFK